MVPVHDGVVEAEGHPGLPAGLREHLEDVLPVAGPHNVIVRVGAVEDAEAVVVLGGDDDVPDPGDPGQPDPLFGIEVHRIEVVRVILIVREGDLEQLQRLNETISDSSLCALGRTAPNPVLTTLTHFRAEYEAHINKKRCPAHICTALVQGYHVIAERCVACGKCLAACPVTAIAFSERHAIPDDATKRTAVIDAETCIRCGHCARICPASAIEREW